MGGGAMLGLMDIPSFLRMHPPFDDLDDERLADVVRHTQITGCGCPQRPRWRATSVVPTPVRYRATITGQSARLITL